MNLRLFCCLILAVFVARATCVTNAEFFEQLQETGDVKELSDVPDNVDKDTIILTGDPGDVLDEDFLAGALGLEPTNTDHSTSGKVDVSRMYPKSRPFFFNIFRAATHITRTVVRFWRRRRAKRDRHIRRAMADTTTTGSNERCVKKSVVVKFDQPKIVTQTYCVRATQLSQNYYDVRLEQGEQVIFANQIMMTEPSRNICGPFLSDPDMNACVNFRLDGASLCALMAADFWSIHKIGVDFGCMEMTKATAD